MSAGLAVVRSTHTYDLERLHRDVATAVSIQDFSEGAYGHCISLPDAAALDERFRSHPINLPFSRALDRCPYLREILDGFTAPKASFRLLRRTARSAYSLHDDKDKGAGVIRAQIPILTNDRSYLALGTDPAALDVFDRYPEVFRANREGDIWFDLATVERVWGEDLVLFQLEPGYLYYFDTDRVHTLINAGDTDRITLCVDLVLEAWLEGWMAEHVTVSVPPVRGPRSASVRWKWNALAHGLIVHE